VSRRAPGWALSAQALCAVDDPHLQPRVHLRVLPSLALGLPVAPLVVGRVLLGRGERVGESVDAVWTDAEGRRLSPPFELGETGPATAWLPSAPDDPVVWAEVEAKDGPGFRVDAVVSGLLGPAVVAGATRPPWQVCATGIDRVVARGEGWVVGLRTLRAGRVDPREVKPWRMLALPVEEAFRYMGVPDAWSESKDRVVRGAPQLLGLHDDPSVPNPASCSPASPDDELDRVVFLWEKRLKEMVDVLLNDRSAAPFRLRMPPEALHGAATAATLQAPPLAAVLQAALDPGVGRFAGLVEHDEAPPSDEGDVVLYTVRGAWTLHAEALGPRLWWLAQGTPDDPGAFPLELPASVVKEPEGRFADLWTAAAVVIGAEMAAPERPLVEGTEDLGWMPEVPPAGRRHIALSLSGLGPAAAVALARESPGFGGLNPRLPELFENNPPDRALPIVCGILGEAGPSPAATAPGQGEVQDRGAPPEAVGYRVAQSDWFGRWSQWTFASAAAGVRPAVPVPVLEAAFVPPSTPGGGGTLEVRCLQPRDPDLPPGGLPLWSLEVRAWVGGAPVDASAFAERGGVPAGVDAEPLVVSIPVPALAPAEKRWLLVSGRWMDTGSRRSVWSPQTRAQASDPRAPAALTLPNALDYGSRPDALGRSRVRLEWTAASVPIRYRVYHSDETTLLQRLSVLAGPEAAAARAGLDAAVTAPDRAAVFRSHAGLFDRSCFELLTASPLELPGGGRLTYEHNLSGSLRVLAFYRVVPVSGLGAEAAFTSCSLLPRAVPNTPPPPTPLLTVAGDPADPARALLAVSVPAGATVPVAVRLRRSRVSGADPLGMPIVAVVEPGSWPATIVDDGSTPWDPILRFAPWSTYTWCAEVQGAPEPGSAAAGRPVPGAWSAPSAPASWRAVPAPPGGATPGTAVSTPAGVEVTFTIVSPLDAGPEGTYTIDVYRVTPNGSTLESGPLGTFAAGAIRQPDGSYLVRESVPIPPGTVYRVEVADPLGRRGPRVDVATFA
jgi:hypothetical protein